MNHRLMCWLFFLVLGAWSSSLGGDSASPAETRSAISSPTWITAVGPRCPLFRKEFTIPASPTGGVVRIVEATYAELVLPSDTATPLVLRVLAASPDAVVGVLGTWLLGEAWGGWAARFVILEGRRIGSALWTALRWFGRAPGRGLVAVLAGLVVGRLV